MSIKKRIVCVCVYNLHPAEENFWSDYLYVQFTHYANTHIHAYIHINYTCTNRNLHKCKHTYTTYLIHMYKHTYTYMHSHIYIHMQTQYTHLYYIPIFSHICCTFPGMFDVDANYCNPVFNWIVIKVDLNNVHFWMQQVIFFKLYVP